MKQNGGMNNDTLKRRNRGLLLRLIVTEPDISRVELAKRTGLSKMSVSNVISEFLERDWVREQHALAVRGQGRNPIGLNLSPNAPKVIGLHIFRDACTALLCDLRLRVWKERSAVLHGESAKDLAGLLCGLVDAVAADAKGDVLGIGVGSIGPVDLRSGTILTPPNFFGMHDFPAVDVLRARYECPVYLDSQYNCAALAEKYYGGGKSYQDFIFVGIANGIGSGIVANGEILRNANGFTSEIGHMSIDWRGSPCVCGNRGCLETYAGIRVMERRLRRATGKNLDFQSFCHLADQEGAAEVDALFLEMSDALGCALTNAVNLLQPEAVIIGHEGYYLPARYLRRIEEQVNRRKLVQPGKQVKVVKSAFGAKAQVLGCACSLLECAFRGELF